MERSTFLKWMDQGSLSIPVVFINNYKKLGLNEEAFVVLLQVHASIQSGNPFPTPLEICSNMAISEQKCTEVLRKCLQIGVLEIKEQQDEDLRYSEVYSLEPLWEKIIDLFEYEEVRVKNKALQVKEQNVYSIFEKEFGRPLSPIECETLTIWLDQDHHLPDLIITALKEAVLSGKMNFRYIDRILFEWKKNGINTIEEARQYGEKFRRYNTRKTPQKEKPTNNSNNESVPFFNWLEQP
jgi:DNA replication protein